MTTTEHRLEPRTDPDSPHNLRRRLLQSVVGGTILVTLIASLLYVESRHSTPTTSRPTHDVPAGPVTALQTPGFGFGFYSAGLRLVDCYGSCRVGTEGDAAEKARR